MRKTILSNKDKLIEAISNSTSASGVLIYLGLTARGTSNFTTLKKYAKLYNLEIPNGNKNSTVQRKAIPLNDVLIRGSSYDRKNLKRRLVREGILEYKCDSCGINEWLGKALSLQLHHKNGIPDDNRLDNLQLLCPNCHTQTDNYSGKSSTKAKEPVPRKPRKRKFEILPEHSHLSNVELGIIYGVSESAVRKRRKL